MSWRRDETYVRVKGEWVYLYRAVDQFGKTIHFLLTDKRDQAAAKRLTRPMLGFKSFDTAQATFVGIELVQMIQKG